MILISATWLGVYVAKRITRPVQLLAAGAKEIGAGHFDYRVEPQSTDKFGSLVDAFNAMTGELSSSRLLSVDHSTIGQPAAAVFSRDDLQPLSAVLTGAREATGSRSAQEVALGAEGHEVHLAVAASALPRESGAVNGTVMVFDDVTPLIRAQRVATWRDVVRRLAHEIKNPLTPIQLCAERICRHFAAGHEASRALVDECTATIVDEVEALKALVDEFSQFARMPSPRNVTADLNALLDETVGLYEGLFKEIAVERDLSPDLPLTRFDPEQLRRVVVNLIDNAVDALEHSLSRSTNGRRGVIVVQTERDDAAGVVRLIVRDNGPGIPEADREKLFMPYFSTKRRGSGLGLAIVCRIVVEHGGSIQVGENLPHGTVFAIELPSVTVSARGAIEG